MARKLMSWRGVTVNGVSDYLVGIPNDSQVPHAVDVTLQQRVNRSPVVRSMRHLEITMPFIVTAPPHIINGGAAPYADWQADVMHTFRVGGEEGILVARRDISDAATEMLAWGVVRRITPRGNDPTTFDGEFLIPDGHWYGAEQVETTTPFTVLGNAEARPLITVTGDAADRYRMTIRDRTGHGVGGWLVGVAWLEPEEHTWVWVNGISVPFLVADGRLWFRVDITTEGPTLVDVYATEGAENAVTAGRLDDAGTDLSAALAAGTSVVAEMGTAGTNPISASLTWHPGIAGAHTGGTPYTFGLSAPDQITIIDRTASGERTLLSDDADAFVFTSPVEMASISTFDITIASGIRVPDVTDESEESRSVQTQNTKDGPAYLRIKVGAHGPSIASEYGEDGWRGTGHADAFYVNFRQLDEYDDGIATSGDLPDPPNTTAFTFGGSVGNCYGAELQVDIDDPETDPHNVYNQLWYMDGDTIQDGIEAAADGATVSQPSERTYLLTFPQGSYKGNDLPFLSFTNDSDISMIVQQAWVDADGNVITDTGGGPSAGKTKAVLWYWKRDDETPYPVWSTTVHGTPGAEAQSVTVPARTFPGGAVQVALGLEPIADGETSIDWGVLTIVTNPTLTFVAGKAPQVIVSEAIVANYIDGTLSIDTDGDGAANSRITLTGIFCDAGLSIDADALWIEGIDGLGDVYGRYQFRDPNAWVTLPPDDVEWEVTGNLADVTFSYFERWAV